MKRNRLPEGWLFVVAILGLGGLLLAIYAFSRPIVSPVSAEIPYQQNGAFNYGSAAPATVYAGSHLQTGDPIYDSLVPTFEVTFDYSLATAASAKMSGTSSLRLRVSEPNGWSRELPLQPETAFVGQAVTARGTADLRTVRRMISLLENATGVDRDAYWVDVLADVEVQGQMDGHPFQASFAPHLPFALDDDQLYLLTGDGPNATDTDPTRPNAEGSVSYLTLQPATLTILGAEVPVTTARGVAVLALLASLAGLVALLLPAYQARRAGGAAPILLEYGSAIVAVGGPPPTGPGGMIDVRSFDDLARLAERTGQTILDFEVGGEHHFYLRDGEVVYHLAVPAPAPPPAGQE